MKYNISVNDQKPFAVETGLDRTSGKMEQILLNDDSVEWSVAKVAPDIFSVLYKDKSYRAECILVDRKQKKVKLKVNDSEIEVKIQEPVDMVLEKMGWESAAQHKTNQIVSPMPGMILKVHVKEGQQIEKGDPILVLEAMKMENVFKASEAARIKEVKVKENTVVEKGVVLVVLE